MDRTGCMPVIDVNQGREISGRISHRPDDHA
jgi:hypothetical protein